MRGPIRPQQFRGVNWDSPQLDGLVYWWPLYTNRDFRSQIFGERASEFGTSRDWSHVSDFGRSVHGPATANVFLRLDSTRITAAPLTLCGWTKPPASGSPIILSICNGSLSDRYFSIDTENGDARAVARDGPFSAATVSGVVADEWQHVGGTFVSSTSRRAWLNGQPGAEHTTDITPTSVNRIGLGVLYRSVPVDHHLGGFADLRIYNRALTDAEMRALYDPQTRWDLYWQPSRRVYSLPPVATGFQPAWARGSNIIIGAGGMP